MVEDPSDKVEKALKLIRLDDSSADDREIDTLKNLHHQNIIRYFASGVIGEECQFVLMELGDYDLSAMIQEKKLTNFEEKLNIFKQICKGIQYIHKVEKNF